MSSQPSNAIFAETLAQPAYNKADGPTKVSYNYGNSEGNQVEPVYNRGDRRLEEFLIKGISGRALQTYNSIEHRGNTVEDTIYVKNSRKVRPRALITNLTEFQTICRDSALKENISQMISNINDVMNPYGDTRMFVCRGGSDESNLEFVCVVVHLYMSEYGATCDYFISTYSYKQQKKTNELPKKPENLVKTSSKIWNYILSFFYWKPARTINNYLLEANFIDKLVESGFAKLINNELMITED
ncbi:unnamed protein product [Auanema sp. JU1783]|nr:unnamed protein product [Auanema sp. JU1783]